MTQHAATHDPFKIVYFQDDSPGTAQYGAFWINSIGTVYVNTPLGWVQVGGPASQQLVSPDDTVWVPSIDNDGVVSWTPQ